MTNSSRLASAAGRPMPVTVSSSRCSRPPSVHHVAQSRRRARGSPLGLSTWCRIGTVTIVLAEQHACGPGDGAPRGQLLDEHDPAAPAFVDLAAHVEPQVHLVEVAMKRNRHAQHAAYRETEIPPGSQNVRPCQKSSSVPRRHVRRKHCRIDLKIHDRQVPPLGRQKRG